MLSFLTNKLNSLNQNTFYPLPRSEGRVKAHGSCSDFRAWSLHEQDVHDYLVYVIKLNDIDPPGFLSKRTFIELLKALYGGGDGAAAPGGGALDLSRFGTSTPAAEERIDGHGDRECEAEMQKKDDMINDLRDELDDWKLKYQLLMDQLNQMNDAKLSPSVPNMKERKSEPTRASGSTVATEGSRPRESTGSATKKVSISEHIRISEISKTSEPRRESEPTPKKESRNVYELEGDLEPLRKDELEGQDEPREDSESERESESRRESETRSIREPMRKRISSRDSESKEEARVISDSDDYCKGLDNYDSEMTDDNDLDAICERLGYGKKGHSTRDLKSSSIQRECSPKRASKKGKDSGSKAKAVTYSGKDSSRSREAKSRNKNRSANDSIMCQCDDKDKQIEELKMKLCQLQKEKEKLCSHNAELTKNVNQFNEHIDSLSDLKEKICECAESGLFADNNKYKQLLEETLKTVICRETMCTSKELKKERKKYEDRIREQLARMLEMYEEAICRLKSKESELEKYKAELENLKFEHDSMSSKCICGREDGYNNRMNNIEEDNGSIVTIDELNICSSAPIISIEMTHNLSMVQQNNQYYNGCTRETCRDSNSSYSEQQLSNGMNRHSLNGRQMYNDEYETQTLVTRRHHVSPSAVNYPIIANPGVNNEYLVHGNPSIEVKIPFTNYTLLLQPT